MRLIDADALKEAVNKKNVVGRFNTIQLIDNAPTADESDIQAMLNKRCMTIVTNEYLIALQGIRTQGEWIPVSERLPEERTSVLVWCPERENIYCAHLEDNQWWIFGAYSQKVEFEVTAWMPMPEPYKEAEE